MAEKSVAARKEDCLVVEIIPACDNQRKLVLLRGLKTEAIHFFHFSPSVSRQPFENLSVTIFLSDRGREADMESSRLKAWCVTIANNE